MGKLRFYSKSFNSFDLLSLSIPLQSWEPFGTPYLNFTFIAFFIFVFNNLLLPFKNSSLFKKVLIKYGLYIIALWLILLIQAINYDFEGSITTYSIPRQMIMAIFLFLFTTVILIKKPSYSKRFFYWYLIGLNIIIFLYFTGIGVEYKAGRLKVMGENSNGLAGYFIIGIIYLLHKIIILKKYRLLYLLAIFILLVIDTGSRTGIIITGIIPFLLIYFSSFPLKHKVGMFAGTIFLVASFLFLVSQDKTAASRFSEIKTESDNEEMFGHRLPIWQNAIKSLEKNILFGIGPSGHERFVIYESRFRDKPRGMHNTFILVLVYAGLVGILIFTIFLIKILHNTLVINKTLGNPIYITYFILIILIGLVATWIVHFWVWVIFSIITSKTFLINNAGLATRYTGKVID